MLNEGVGLVNSGGVTVEVCGLATDGLPLESGETDEPADETGAQLTPGVIGDDGLVIVVDLEPVALPPVVPVGPVLPAAGLPGVPDVPVV